MRDISEFHGENVIIGCGPQSKICSRECHNSSEDFYSIDLDPLVQPDFVFDIRGELPESFNDRFNVTLFENIDFHAYNNDASFLRNTTNLNGEKGLQNALKMTEQDGFIFIIGCPRYKCFRSSFKDLKYIELPALFPYQSPDNVIIPKNQDWDIETVRAKIKSNPEMIKIITRLLPKRYSVPSEYPLNWSKVDYDSLFANVAASMSAMNQSRLFNSRSITPNLSDLPRAVKHRLDEDEITEKRKREDLLPDVPVAETIFATSA